MADRIAAAKVPVVVHPTMQRAGSSMETLNSHLGNAAVLADREHPARDRHRLRGLRAQDARAAARGGDGDGQRPRLRPGAARRSRSTPPRCSASTTASAASRPGKVADLVLYDGDPFEHATHVTHTLMDGRWSTTGPSI